MSHICLWSPGWAPEGEPAPETAAALLELAPRVAVGRDVVWVDGRGLDAAALAAALLERIRGLGLEKCRAGVAATPVGAEAAARWRAADASPAVVEAGQDREFLAPAPLGLLEPDASLLALLDGVGIGTCGELAALDREAVEVRFGPAGVALWRLARADDPRRLFAPAPPERPHASLDFVDYVLTDPARLVFTANALLGSICNALAGRGEHARRLGITLSLANGREWRRTLRPARPTASRATWLRLVRTEFERLTVPDAVAGMSIEVEATEAAAVRQGDLFDHGFATAEAVESAIARLIEGYGPVVVSPESSAHPLVERRTRWRARDPADVDAPPPASPDARTGVAPVAAAPPPGIEEDADGPAGRLTLQLLPEPRAIAVETVARRDHRIPVRYRDGRGRQELVVAAGPDRISGDRWGDAYAREYFRCVTTDGILVWLFRNARTDAWFLHGWWD